MLRSKTHNIRFYRARLIILAIITIAIVTALVSRLSYLFLIQQSFLEKQGDARTVRTTTIPAYRGIVFDRNGEPLAVSTAVATIWINPSLISNILADKEIASSYSSNYNKLNSLLGLTKDKDRIQNKVKENPNKEFMYIKRQIDPALAEKIQSLDLPGVYVKREFKRYYPNGEVTAHILGLTSIEDKGQEGIESAYDQKLTGIPGKQQIIQDRMGRKIKTIKQVSVAKPGEDIKLTIDLRLQYLTYTALAQIINDNKANAGTAILLDIKSGEVLALVNQPSYNPNNPQDRIKIDYKEVRNRAITDVFEPGSLIKPFSMAAALNTGKFPDDLIIDTSPGKYKIDKYTVQDVRDFGPLSLGGILKKSSNIGVVKLTLQSEPNNLINLLHKVGFTEQTSVHLPGEATGWINPIKPGADHRLATLSFGYGIAVTPLQLIQAYSILGNNGKLVPITFLSNQTEHSDHSEKQVLSKAVSEKVLAMLNGVMQTDGTGKLAMLEDYETVGKSGTTRRLTREGYDPNRHNSLFVGMAPYPNPRLAMLVFVIDPQGKSYYGGEVAGPIFKKVMPVALRLYGIPPNKYTKHTDLKTNS